MKILFFGAKSYDIKSFDAYLDKEEYKDLDVVYIEPNLTPQTAMLAAGYEAVCAFVNMDLSAETIDILNTCKVKLILMRCAGFNNVDLERAKGYGMTTRAELLTGSCCRACDGTGSDGKPPHAQSIYQST